MYRIAFAGVLVLCNFSFCTFFYWYPPVQAALVTKFFLSATFPYCLPSFLVPFRHPSAVVIASTVTLFTKQPLRPPSISFRPLRALSFLRKKRFLQAHVLIFSRPDKLRKVRENQISGTWKRAILILQILLLHVAATTESPPIIPTFMTWPLPCLPFPFPHLFRHPQHMNPAAGIANCQPFSIPCPSEAGQGDGRGRRRGSGGEERPVPYLSRAGRGRWTSRGRWRCRCIGNAARDREKRKKGSLRVGGDGLKGAWHEREGNICIGHSFISLARSHFPFLLTSKLWFKFHSPSSPPELTEAKIQGWEGHLGK